MEDHDCEAIARRARTMLDQANADSEHCVTALAATLTAVGLISDRIEATLADEQADRQLALEDVQQLLAGLAARLTGEYPPGQIPGQATAPAVLAAELHRAYMPRKIVIVLDGDAQVIELPRARSPHDCPTCRPRGVAVTDCVCGGTGYATLTPAQHADALRELAEQGFALRERIETAHSAMSGPDDESLRRVSHPLSDLQGAAMGVVNGLNKLAVRLERIAAIPADACRIPWGICPEHGNTLTSTGGVSTCRRCQLLGILLDGQVAPGWWDYDRLDGPCPEPKWFVATFPNGDRASMCVGHASAIRDSVVGGTVRPLTGDDRP